MKIDFKEIYVQELIQTNPTWQKKAETILARFPEATVIPVKSHWGIQSLFEADPADWMTNKRNYLVLGVRSSLSHQKNGRSADFIAASSSNGCLSSCQYCYVARRKGGSNPLTIFVNIEEIAESIRRHQARLGPKTEPNQCDPQLWTYDIGCNSDLSLDAMICDHPGYLIQAFAEMPHAKATFATKTVNDEYWLSLNPKGHTRIRYSIMPQPIARYVDIATSPIPERIQSINRLVAGGYEVHLNFSPIILYGGEQWRHDWVETWRQLDETLTPEAKAQLACEVFFLTHSAELHEINLRWNPKGESFLWSPEVQQPKWGKPDVLNYDRQVTRRELDWFLNGLKNHLPYCTVRYAF